jgi:hypothetical protein
MAGLGANPAPVAFQPIDEAAVLPIVAQHSTRGAAGLAAVELKSKKSKFSQRVATHGAALNAKINSGPVRDPSGCVHRCFRGRVGGARYACQRHHRNRCQQESFHWQQPVSAESVCLLATLLFAPRHLIERRGCVSHGVCGVSATLSCNVACGQRRNFQ